MLVKVLGVVTKSPVINRFSNDDIDINVYCPLDRLYMTVTFHKDIVVDVLSAEDTILFTGEMRINNKSGKNYYNVRGKSYELSAYQMTF